MANTDKGESVSDTEYLLPRCLQLRVARPHDANDQPKNPTASVIPMTDEASTLTPSPVTDQEDAEENSVLSTGERRRNICPVGYIPHALLVLRLVGMTVAVLMTGYVESNSSSTMPVRAFGTLVDGPSWTPSPALLQAIALGATLTAGSRTRAKAPVSTIGCVSDNGAGDNRDVHVIADMIYWPLPQGTYTAISPFTMRISLIFGQPLAREGIDVAAPLDTPITSVHADVAKKATENPRSGAYVQIKHTHSDGTVFHSAYLHQYMSRIMVRADDIVTVGRIIGAVGDNGQSIGPHLHFEIHDSSDTPADPDIWIQTNKAIYLGQESCS